MGGLFFYPKAVQDRAVELGLRDYETIKRRFRGFMTAFLIFIIGGWNDVSNFRTAYGRALLLLEVKN